MSPRVIRWGERSFPAVLRDMPQPPRQLYCLGADLSELLKKPRVTIVGSRRVSPYGKQVTQELATRLAERSIVIISGLALGVDGLAHEAALEAGGITVAVLPSPLDNIVPVRHQRLAREILEQGGALVSEYPPGSPPLKHNFVERNRLMAGLGHVTVITEATAHSGSIHTANFALDQGKTVMAVPGNITSPLSAGTNTLLQTSAMPVTSYKDVLFALGIDDQASKTEIRGRNSAEQTLIELLRDGLSDGQALLAASELGASEFSQTLTMLEITGRIRSLGANHWALR
ncbi:MAG TPA: DNA-processing protein DprA [Candidatus Saccharimonadales bacterium]|nr:DNA-processing protein DprA [Candidatus Saccharimonadales bacterium]